MEEATTDLKQYVQLRTMLDSLEIGALRYYLNAANPAEQQEHFKYLKTQLKPIIEHIWQKKKEREIECPPGYNECDGCCVPYICVH